MLLVIYTATGILFFTFEIACTGDEYAQTRNGNNNWYGHDSKMTRFDWDQLGNVKDTFFRFYR